MDPIELSQLAEHQIAREIRSVPGVALVNLGDAPYRISHGDRIAQMIVAPVIQVQFQEVEALSDTARGVGGFGSTGKR